MKFHRVIFNLLLILLPLQLGMHFWPDWSFVYGIRIDYLSPAIYLTDVLVLLILIFWLLEEKPSYDFFHKEFMLAIVYLIFTSLFTATNLNAAIFKIIKFTEFYALFYYVRLNYKTSGGMTNFLNRINYPLFYSSLIAVLQFIKKGSLGNIFWFLGERSLTTSTPGIAITLINGKTFLRPYSIFPHPNVLAGFLGFLVIPIFLKVKKTLFDYLVLGVSLIALLLTNSQSCFLALIFIFIFFYLRRLVNLKKLLEVFLVSVILFSFIFPLIKLPQNLPEDVLARQKLSLSALNIFKISPVFGVGLNNFLIKISDFSRFDRSVWNFQPVHNLFLLVLSETGIIGFLFLLLFLRVLKKKLTRSENIPLLLMVMFLLITGSLDHYWFTLQQPGLLLAIFLGLVWGSSKAFNL